MKCKECGKEPFGVESWPIPRGEDVERIVLCPDCSGMDGGLNIIEEEVLKQINIGLQQCRDGKGITTEELKEKFKDIRAKWADITKDCFDESDY